MFYLLAGVLFLAANLFFLYIANIAPSWLIVFFFSTSIFYEFIALCFGIHSLIGDVRRCNGGCNRHKGCDGFTSLN